MLVRDFLEHHNGLIIGGEATGSYQIVLGASEEVWETFNAPAEEDEINATISNIAQTLPTGKHALRLQAISTSRSIRGQTMVIVDGRSVAAKRSGEEKLVEAKALAMNIATAEQQLNTMSTRLTEAEERTRIAEERAGGMMVDHYKMLDMVHKMVLDKEAQDSEKEDKKARTEAFMTIAQTMAPILGQAIMVGMKYMEFKIKDWEAEWAAKSEANQKATKEKYSNGASSPPKEEVKHEN